MQNLYERLGGTRQRILNPAVASAVEKDFELFLVFLQLHSGYDSDVDPIHNPDYVRRAMKEEAALLVQAREELSKTKLLWQPA